MTVYSYCPISVKYNIVPEREEMEREKKEKFLMQLRSNDETSPRSKKKVLLAPMGVEVILARDPKHVTTDRLAVEVTPVFCDCMLLLRFMSDDVRPCCTLREHADPFEFHTTGRLSVTKTNVSSTTNSPQINLNLTKTTN